VALPDRLVDEALDEPDHSKIVARQTLWGQAVSGKGRVFLVSAAVEPVVPVARGPVFHDVETTRLEAREQDLVGAPTPGAVMRGVVDHDIQAARRVLGADRVEALRAALIAERKYRVRVAREVHAAILDIDSNHPPALEEGREHFDRLSGVDPELQHRHRPIGEVREILVVQRIKSPRLGRGVWVADLIRDVGEARGHGRRRGVAQFHS
jgi:hypothetical protein